MVNVAVAGGLGNFGRTVTEVLKSNPKHAVFVLGRTVPDTNDMIAPFITVDYDNEDSLLAVLERNQIHAVVSCLAITSDSAFAAETNLIRAADRSSVTKRFITSNWGGPVTPKMAEFIPFIEYKLKAIEELKKTDLEWTQFVTGFFLDYYGMPHIKTHLLPFIMAVDIANKVASIPGTGNDIVAFTYTYDVAKFVVIALDLPKWEEETIIIGDKATWNDFLKLAEEVRGSRFDVSYDSVEKLKTSQITELPAHISSYPFYPKERLQFYMAGLERAMIAGMLDPPEEKALNTSFPDIKLLKIRDILEQTWKDA